MGGSYSKYNVLTRLLVGAMIKFRGFLSQLCFRRRVLLLLFAIATTIYYYSRRVSVVVRGKRERNLPKRTLTRYSDPLLTDKADHSIGFKLRLDLFRLADIAIIWYNNMVLYCWKLFLAELIHLMYYKSKPNG